MRTYISVEARNAYGTYFSLMIMTCWAQHLKELLIVTISAYMFHVSRRLWAQVRTIALGFTPFWINVLSPIYPSVSSKPMHFENRITVAETLLSKHGLSAYKLAINARGTRRVEEQLVKVPALSQLGSPCWHLRVSEVQLLKQAKRQRMAGAFRITRTKDPLLLVQYLCQRLCQHGSLACCISKQNRVTQSTSILEEVGLPFHVVFCGPKERLFSDLQSPTPTKLAHKLTKQPVPEASLKETMWVCYCTLRVRTYHVPAITIIYIGEHAYKSNI